MRYLATLIIIVFIILISFCKSDISYSIVRNKEVLLNDSLCTMISYFPTISTPNSDLKSINKFLKNINDVAKFKREYLSPDTNLKNKIIVIGDYSILLKVDSLISFEYSTTYTNLSESKVIYKAIFLNPIDFKLLEPKDAFPIFDRSVLLKHVKRFCDTTNIRINLRAYEQNSKYSIMYGITRENLILYLGGEAEFYGNYKISIPLEEFDSHSGQYLDKRK